jgi:bifunctional UDP-N-acetylglucosamine pyrophosphorylase/glucosamine-1-phosphate N-acetyltransferase
VSLGTVVILAAGRGTRMRSARPKLVHDLCGRPLVGWPIAAAREAGAEDVILVVAADTPLDEVLGDGVRSAVQAQPDGTGGALLAAAGLIARGVPLIVTAGDVPLVDADLLRELAAAHAHGGAPATMVTIEVEDPSAATGAIVRDADGAIERVVETKHTDDRLER